MSGGAARLESADCVVAAIVGAAGLSATLPARAAAKEAIVCAGSLLLEAIAERVRHVDAKRDRHMPAGRRDPGDLRRSAR